LTQAPELVASNGLIHGHMVDILAEVADTVAAH